MENESKMHGRYPWQPTTVYMVTATLIKDDPEKGATEDHGVVLRIFRDFNRALGCIRTGEACEGIGLSADIVETATAYGECGTLVVTKPGSYVWADAVGFSVEPMVLE